MNNLCSVLLLSLPLFFSACLYVSTKTWRYFLQVILACGYFLLALYALLFSGLKSTYLVMGGWNSQFAITLHFDLITHLFIMFFAFVGMLSMFVMREDHAVDRESAAIYIGYWLLILSALGVLATQDVFNLYVWLEVMLVASVAIITSSTQYRLGKALKEYAFINIFSTLLILLAVGLIYAQTGILSYRGIATYIAHHSSFTVVPIYILIIGLLIKGAAFPFYFWLPNTYPMLSNTARLLLGGMNTKLIMLSLIRLYVIWGLPSIHHGISTMLAWVGVATMFFGVMGAANQMRIHQILSFHITSQIGYVLLAISFSTTWGFVAAIFFIIHNILTKSALFVTAGYAEHRFKTDHLSVLGAIFSRNRFNAILFFLAAMSLAGFPPLSGFIGKYLVLKAALLEQHYLYAFFALLVSFFTLYSMIKIWRFGFCQPNEQSDGVSISHASLTGFYIASVSLILAMLVISIFPDILLKPLLAVLGG